MTQAITLHPKSKPIPTAKSLPLLGAIPQLMRSNRIGLTPHALIQSGQKPGMPSPLSRLGPASDSVSDGIFAYMEGQLILIRLLQRYRLFSSGREVEPVLSTTLRPSGRIKLQLERR
ncbi:MAG: hypothetical protein AAF633_07520 [Chloroflexota bacterium]